MYDVIFYFDLIPVYSTIHLKLTFMYCCRIRLSIRYVSEILCVAYRFWSESLRQNGTCAATSAKVTEEFVTIHCLTGDPSLEKAIPDQLYCNKHSRVVTTILIYHNNYGLFALVTFLGMYFHVNYKRTIRYKEYYWLKTYFKNSFESKSINVPTRLWLTEGL